MSKRSSYSYSILRYVHDISTGEFVNVAVVMQSHDGTFFKFKNKATTGRISALFPNFKPAQFKSLMKMVRERFQVMERDCNAGLWNRPASKPASLLEVLSRTVPKDDSSLVWSDISGGASDNLDATFERVFSRYVTRFDQKITHGRTDEDVWRSFKKDLEKRNVLRFFTQKKIYGKDDEVEFSLAWKNGIWHCIEPISFDLCGSDTIRDKAHKFLGQLTSVADSSEQFKLYIVAARPRDSALSDAFTRAIHILDKIPAQKEIFTDEQSSSLADHLSDQILADVRNKQGLLVDNA